MASHDGLLFLLQSVGWTFTECGNGSYHCRMCSCKVYWLFNERPLSIVNISVKPVTEYLDSFPADIALFGCSAIELLYLRGNGEEVQTMVSSFQCNCCTLFHIIFTGSSRVSSHLQGAFWFSAREMAQQRPSSKIKTERKNDYQMFSSSWFSTSSS